MAAKLSFIEDVSSPRLYYTDLVANQINYLVDQCKKEVGWLGLLDKIEGHNAYIVTEIFVPDQIVNAAETDISGVALVKLHEELEEAGKDPNKLRYWGHSHVNMGVSPSSQDLSQIKEYQEGGIPFFIMAIYNKKGDRNVEFFDFDSGVRHAGIWNGRMVDPLSIEECDKLDELIRTNVRNSIYSTPYNNGYNQPYNRKNRGGRNNFNKNSQSTLPVIPSNLSKIDDKIDKKKEKGKKTETKTDTKNKSSDKGGGEEDKTPIKTKIIPVTVYNDKNEIVGEKDLYWNHQIGFYGKGVSK